MGKNKQVIKNSNNDDKNPDLSEDFTNELLNKINRRQTIKDYLYMFVVGFRKMLEGFFKLETVKNLSNKEEEG